MNNCRECGAKIPEKTTTNGRDRKFCDIKCANRYKLKNKLNLKTKKCSFCQKEFTPNLNLKNMCSPDCCRKSIESVAHYRWDSVHCHQCGFERVYNTKEAKRFKRNEKFFCNICTAAARQKGEIKKLHCEKCGLPARVHKDEEKKLCAGCRDDLKREHKSHCQTCKKQLSAYMVERGHSQCGWCRKNPGLARKLGAITNSEVKVNRWPCASCDFGRSSEYAETGWECLANAAACKPWGPKNLYRKTGLLV